MTAGKPELSPCPFCGSTDLKFEWLAFTVCVFCKFCRTYGPEAPDKVDAIELWNNREGIE